MAFKKNGSVKETRNFPRIVPQTTTMVMRKADGLVDTTGWQLTKRLWALVSPVTSGFSSQWGQWCTLLVRSLLLAWTRFYTNNIVAEDTAGFQPLLSNSNYSTYRTYGKRFSLSWKNNKMIYIWQKIKKSATFIQSSHLTSPSSCSLKYPVLSCTMRTQSVWFFRSPVVRNILKCKQPIQSMFINSSMSDNRKIFRKFILF